MITKSSMGCFGIRRESSRQIKAVEAIRRMRGGSQSVLVRASDDVLYVVKMMGNPQGPNVLANEALGSQLAAYMGLNTPAWRPIELSADFLDRNRICWFESADGLVRPPAGRHFASRAFGQMPGECVYDTMPGTWLSRAVDCTDFARMLVVDLWTKNTDNRQAAFVASGNLRNTIFLDHGHMFGGPHGQARQKPGASMFLDRRVYASPSLSMVFQQCVREIRALNETTVLDFARSIPFEWMNANYLHSVLMMLRERKIALNHLLDMEMTMIPGTGLNRSAVRARDGRLPAPHFPLGPQSQSIEAAVLIA